MPISNSNKLYQFHIEASPTNSYDYFCETIRTQPHFSGLRNSHSSTPHNSNSIRVRYSNSVDTRVGLHVCALPQRRYGLPHHGAVSRDHYLIHYLFHNYFKNTCKKYYSTESGRRQAAECLPIFIFFTGSVPKSRTHRSTSNLQETQHNVRHI